jgi:hypothetical protein
MYCKQQSLHAVQNSRYEYGGSSRGLSGYNRPEAASQKRRPYGYRRPIISTEARPAFPDAVKELRKRKRRER